MPIYKRVLCFFTSICLCFSFVAVWFHPVEAHADVGEFSGAIDYFTSLPSAEVQALSPAGFAVAGAVFAVNQALSHPIEGVPAIDASSLTTFSGVYAIGSGSNRQIKLATVSIYSGSFNASDGDGVSFIYGDDYDNICRFYGNFSTIKCKAFQNGTSFIIDLAGIGGSGYMQIYNFRDNTSANTSSSYQPFLDFNVYTANTIPTYKDVSFIAQYGYLGTSRPDLIGNAIQVQLPAGTIDSSYPQILIQWVNDTYPEYTYLFPDVPPEPIYPTDFVTGIPKDWTIENPPLPTSPNVSLSPRDADFSVIDPSEAVAQNATAFDFWWWLTDRILTYTDMKNIVVLFVGLGAVSYILWRIGR